MVRSLMNYFPYSVALISVSISHISFIHSIVFTFHLLCIFKDDTSFEMFFINLTKLQTKPLEITTIHATLTKCYSTIKTEQTMLLKLTQIRRRYNVNCDSSNTTMAPRCLRVTSCHAYSVRQIYQTTFLYAIHIHGYLIPGSHDSRHLLSSSLL